MNAAHERFLRKPFYPRKAVDHALFLPGEFEALSKYGSWYEALHLGWIPPETEAQKHFVACAHGHEVPVSFHEKAYLRYLDALKSASNPNSGEAVGSRPPVSSPNPWNTDISESFRRPEDYYDRVIYPTVDESESE